MAVIILNVRRDRRGDNAITFVFVHLTEQNHPNLLNLGIADAKLRSERKAIWIGL